MIRDLIDSVRPKIWAWFIVALFLLMVSKCTYAVTFTDLKFGQYQVADSQWNVSACMYTATCQIYSTNPGTMYKIPWYNGQWAWQSGQYVQFALTGDATNPYEGKVYNSNGSLAGTIGTGHIINMGVDPNGKALFFFVGNDNNTGQLFSSNFGMSGTSGYTWTGTLNPTTAQVDTFASSYGSTTPLASGQTATPSAPPPPTYCCGAVDTPFNADATKQAKVQTFTGRTTNDSQVFIEQIGNQNLIQVEQTGTKNNYVKYYGNGNSNNVSVTQHGGPTTIVNYTDLSVTGSSNTVTVQQQSTGGAKGVFATVSNNNNSLLIQQKDNGSHYVDVVLSGGNKNVDILQEGSAGHMAKIALSGNPVDLSLGQKGSTQMFYSVNYNCTTAGGCPKITVQQGN